MIATVTHFDVIIVGAGPAGSTASSLLNDKGYRVLVLEKEHFPRFSIGESLLPQSMEFLKQAGMLEAVIEAQFQYKNGATFARGEAYDSFDFREKFSPGWGTTFQVQRASFDHILASCAAKQGADVRYAQTVTGIHRDAGISQVDVMNDLGVEGKYSARFVLDASGFGRVLPRLFGLEKASSLASRVSLFTHVEDRINDSRFDRNKVLISVHPQNHDVWYWLIPFANGRASVGVVLPQFIYAQQQASNDSVLKRFVSEGSLINELLQQAEYDTDVGLLQGYSCDVSSLYGDGFALLGNAGEFLDPIFSSGVTIALKSANLACQVLHRQLQGEQPDWERDYSQPLKQGVQTFRTFVDYWYDGSLQKVIFAEQKNVKVKAMICSILAGYAWDLNNPFVRNPKRLSSLVDLC